MDKNISEIFDYGDEIVVVEEQDDLFDPARIKELTMNKINAGSVDTRTRSAIKKTRTARRTALIAAAMVVLLIGTAFAVYQFSLKDLIFADLDNGFSEISVLGWRDTPEYKAFVEWDAYQTEYNSTHEIPNVDDPSIPVAYLRVGAWSQEMVDTLDSILAKHGLTMHDNKMIFLPAEGSGIDVSALLPNAGSVGGYAYQDGTMKLDITQELPDGEKVDCQLFSAVKGTFSNVSSNMEGEAEEWLYTAADGTEVSLVMGDYASMIVADMDRVFVTVHTVFRNVSGRGALEALADSIRWTELNACRGFTEEYYTAFRQMREEKAEESDKAWIAREELGPDWTLIDDEILKTHTLETVGRNSAESGDGSAWVEWIYTETEGDETIRLRYERPAGDIAAIFEEKLVTSGLADAAVVLENVPCYVRTESVEGADTVTEYRDFTVYIDEAADGTVTALWLDTDKDLIFTLTADPDELTDEELKAQIAYLLGGREPYPMQVEPEVVWARLGHYEPSYLPEGWYLDPETKMAVAGTTDGVWTGWYTHAYINGERGHIIWFDYGTAETEAGSNESLRDAIGFTDEDLEELGGYVALTETTVNGHPALLIELNDMNTSPCLLWLDEDAGVLFSLKSETFLGAETLRSMAESVAAQ